jgi:quercetin dioxygenase-like cupin family protein
MPDDQMSDPKQRKRPLGAHTPAPWFDPEAFACWRLLEAAAARMARAVVLPARQAPHDDRLDGHVHAQPTIVACLAGTTRIECSGSTIDLHALEAAVVAPGAWHRHAALRGGSAVYAQGLLGQRSDVMLMQGARRWWLTIHQEPSQRWLYQALHATSPAQRLQAVVALMGGFAREPALAMTMSSAQAAMARYLWGSFTRGITAQDILHASSLQRAQAHLSFRACFGQSPKQALTQARLALATHLQAEGFSAQEIARASGFASSPRWRRTRRAWMARTADAAL